jgi:hypothetical protein
MRAAPIAQAWKVERTSKGIRYRIDEAHPSIAAVLDDATSTQKELILSMLRVIEETVPVQKIWLDTAEQKETPVTSFASSSDEAVLKVMKTLFRNHGYPKGHGHRKMPWQDSLHRSFSEFSSSDCTAFRIGILNASDESDQTGITHERIQQAYKHRYQQCTEPADGASYPEPNLLH